MSYLVENPEDRFSHNEAHLRFVLLLPCLNRVSTGLFMLAGEEIADCYAIKYALFFGCTSSTRYLGYASSFDCSSAWIFLFKLPYYLYYYMYRVLRKFEDIIQKYPEYLKR